MTDTSHALELRQIRKAYGQVQVIHGVDLEIAEGEFVVFVGPSGCGKSTLLRLIAGLDDPTSGDIVLKGKRVNNVPASERGLSMVFQSYALYPHMSVRSNLSFGLENMRMPRAGDRSGASPGRRSSCRSTSCSNGGRGSCRADSGSASPSGGPSCGSR